MRSLLRFASWGFAATAALLLVVVVAHTGNGQRRLAALTGKSSTQIADAKAPDAAKAAKTDTADKERLARLAATETETRRLTEMVRSLNSDRERLQTRLATVERNLEDVTGSIRQQAPPPAPPTPSSMASPSLAVPPTTIAPPQPAPAAEAAAPPGVTQPTEPTKTAAAHPADTTEPEVVRPALGVDVGGAPSFDGLRVLWNSLTSTNSSALDGMQPVVSARENSKTRAPDLRLIAGPVADADTAARLCATLTATKRYCRPATFEGQPLSLSMPEPPRRPKAAPDRRGVRPPVFPNP